jgi:hypothetical protein
MYAFLSDILAPVHALLDIMHLLHAGPVAAGAAKDNVYCNQCSLHVV